MKPPIQLSPWSTSEDVHEACQHLLDDATKGRLIGIAFVAQYRRRTYIVHAAGELRRNPTWARGTLRSLDDELMSILHETGDSPSKS
jgi:hypothetical protein